MSKSTRTPHPLAGKPGKRATARAAVPDARPEPPGRPRMIDGIDYGPAFAAVHGFAAWALDLAARDVADWPEGLRRIGTARQFILARLSGKRPRRVPLEDVLFTAGLLARIFEAKLGRSRSELAAIFARLGFSTDLMPPRSCTPSSADRPQDPLDSWITSLCSRLAASGVRTEPADACNECGQLGARFRVAA
jgi:hypothetical protein